MCGKLLFSGCILSLSLTITPKNGTPEEHSAASPSAPAVISVSQLTHDGHSKTGLLADGSNLYVTEWHSSRHVVSRFALNGTGSSSVPSSFSNLQALDVSVDRAKLLVTPTGNGGENEFWVLPLRAGAPQKIGDLSGRDAVWSPDGRQLIFSKSSTLYVANTDGSGAREIFRVEGSIFAPRLSPDGKHIRFTVGDIAQNTTSLWQVGADGSDPHALLGKWEHASRACCGSWSADGRYYIFQVTQTSPTTVTTLWSLADGSSSPVQLTTGPMSFGDASVSQDNKSIWAIGVQPAAQAVRYDPVRKDFSPVLPGVSATDLDFSSDGEWITYVAVPEGTLWRSRVDGGERQQLSTAPGRTALPHWSPDGKQIAYVNVQPGKPWKISLVSRDGGSSEDVFTESRGQIDANWSHDGSSLMFGSVHGEDNVNVRVVNLKTHVVTTIPGSDGMFSPRLSPDGRYIAALSLDYTKVMLFDYQTHKWSTWLSEAAGAVSYPVWSADSRQLYFDDLVTEEESIRSIKIGESKTQRVLKLEGIERYPGPFGLWSGRATDGSWLFIRDRSTQEVYQLSVVLP
jgi:Tol biopolymer transport system component